MHSQQITSHWRMTVWLATQRSWHENRLARRQLGIRFALRPCEPTLVTIARHMNIGHK